MTFTALSSAVLFALLVPLILFYFLKLKRPRQTIPSLVLWRQVLSDQRVNSPFQRFKRNILLLLQILLLCLLVLAAMQPLLRREAGNAARLPVLVDVSASMGALDKDGGRSRLDEAKARLRERIASMPPGQEICLIAFSRSARKLTPFTDNRRELLDAVASLEVEDVPGDLDEGLRLAQALGRTAPFERVLVLTDGNLPGKTTFELPYQLSLQKLPPAGPNAGITACNARRNAAGDWDLFVQLVCTDPAPSNTATVTLTAGGQEIGQEQVNLLAGGAPRLVFRVSAAGGGGQMVHVALKPAGFDSLASDNDAWLALPAQRPLDVYAPESMAAFRHALASIDGLRVFPNKDEPSPSSYDLAVGESKGLPLAKVSCTTGDMPEELRPLLTVNKDVTQNIRAIDWRRDSPLLQHVSFDEVIFLEDPVLAPGKDVNALRVLGWESLVDGPHGPLMVTHLDEASARVHFLFNPDQSTLPFRVAFPIFAANLANHALRLAGLAEATGIPTGVLPPQPAEANATVTIRGPGNFARDEKANERGVVTGIPAARAGEYTLSAGHTTTKLGASLLSMTETALGTVDEVGFGDRISVKTDTTAPKADRSLWWTLAALGYAVLLLEWWWFQRRPF